MADIKKILHTVYKFSSEVLRCYAPFLILLTAFASFGFIGHGLEDRVHYNFMPGADTALFGQLPTIWLQKLLWHGHVVWYDYIFYGVYASHYLFPIFLAWIVFRRYKDQYAHMAFTYMLTTFSAFIFFIIYPTAPPWLASQNGYIPHITRISGQIFSSFGVHNFAALYSKHVPNPVAAFPSIHTAYAVMFVLFIRKIFGNKWATLFLIYPFCIIVGVVYLGEHYAIDVIAGGLLALASYMIVPVIIRRFQPGVYKIATKLPLASSILDSYSTLNKA